MKYIKLFEEFHYFTRFTTNLKDIKFWLSKYKIKNRTKFEITKNGIVNSPVDVEIYNGGFKCIPFQFGEIKDKFICSHCKELTSLKGCPTKVNHFNCSHCGTLTSLEYAPNGVGYFNCSYCKNISSLEHCPNGIGHLNCDGISITNLEHCPSDTQTISCICCSYLTSLKGCPSAVERISVGWNKNLTNFYYAPKKPTNYDYCKCTDAYDSLGYNEENHQNAGIHLMVAVILKDKETFEDILEDLNKKDKLDLLNVDFLIKSILDYPELIEPIMDSNLSPEIKSELKYAINLSKSDVKAKNIFD